MHEVSLMQETIAIATQRALAAGARRIRRVEMRVGSLSGAVPEALEFAFEVVARGTLAEGAVLVIEPVTTVCYCAVCTSEFEPIDIVCVCPTCDTTSVDVRSGRELLLTSLEVE